MESKILLALRDYLMQLGVSVSYVDLLIAGITVAAIIVSAWLADMITKKTLLSIISKIAAKSKTVWDDILVEKKFFHRLAHFIPILVVYHMSGEALKGFETVRHIVQTVTLAYAVFMGMRVFDAFMSSAQEIYNTLPNARNRSIKGYVQVAKIIVYFIGSIAILAIILNKSMVGFFTGLGAMAAVLTLVFKDAILGFVGGVQLTANDIVRIGDWIEMPSRNIDGTVTDISLTTVKVQNADMTITNIPTYSLVTDSFYNWRGVDDSGGRRIKRSIFLDMKSVKFVEPGQLEKFRQIEPLDRFIARKMEEAKKNPLGNARGMTNIGLFRKYMEAYLQSHPLIRQDMTLVVRQRQPSENGLPIEIYVFAKETKLKAYEEIQSEIFDHILAILPEFGLRVFQNPTGEDFHRQLS